MVDRQQLMDVIIMSVEEQGAQLDPDGTGGEMVSWESGGQYMSVSVEDLAYAMDRTKCLDDPQTLRLAAQLLHALGAEENFIEAKPMSDMEQAQMKRFIHDPKGAILYAVTQYLQGQGHMGYIIVALRIVGRSGSCGPVNWCTLNKSMTPEEIEQALFGKVEPKREEAPPSGMFSGSVVNPADPRVIVIANEVDKMFKELNPNIALCMLLKIVACIPSYEFSHNFGEGFINTWNTVKK